MGEILEVAKVLVEPTIKLMDMVGEAIGTVYEPRHKRKMADATAYEINVIGDAMRNAADLPILYNQDGVVINSEDFNRLMQRAGTRLVLQEVVKQHNIESVVDNAYDILEKEENCSGEPVEQGWLNRFFDSVSNISDEDLQGLWGKILAGEVMKPKSYSLRTLETLKNISKEEAELFQRVCSLVAISNNELFLIADTNVLKYYGITYGDILSLDECGLLNSDGMVSLNPKVSADQSFIVYNKSNLLIINGVSNIPEKISLGIFPLTQAGKELYLILECFSNENYFCTLAEEIEKNNKGKITATLHKIHKFDIKNPAIHSSVLRKFPSKV